SCYDSRYSDVCGYFRYNSDCRSPACKRCFARRCPFLYDGRYYAFAPFNDYASQGGQTETAWYFHWNMCCWYYYCRLSFQRNTIFNCLILGGYYYGIIWFWKEERKRNKRSCLYLQW